MKFFGTKILMISLMFSSAAMADSNTDQIMEFKELESKITAKTWGGNRKKHYCHMETVYVGKMHASADSLALVWNHDTNAPLKCEDYYSYVSKMLKRK